MSCLRQNIGIYSNHPVPGSSFEFCLGKTYFLWVKRILPMIYISEYSWIWICGAPPLRPRLIARCCPPVFRFGWRLLLLSSQQALKASPFTTGIINIICRYGNLHFSNLSLVTFYVVKFKIGSKGVGNHPKLIYQRLRAIRRDKKASDSNDMEKRKLWKTLFENQNRQQA